jgi:hypothetical protein
MQGTYNSKPVAIKTLKNVDAEGVETFLAEADVMTCVAYGKAGARFFSSFSSSHETNNRSNELFVF